MFEIYGGGTELKQWELNKTVTNPCMKEGDDVIFRNAHGQTYVVKAFEEGGVIQADVPNYLLQKSGNILVDLEQGLEHHTECRTTFTVVAQDKPENYDCQCNVPDRPAKNVGGVSSWNDLTDKPFEEVESRPVFMASGTGSNVKCDNFVAEDYADRMEEGKKYLVTLLIRNISTNEVTELQEEVTAALHMYGYIYCNVGSYTVRFDPPDYNLLVIKSGMDSYDAAWSISIHSVASVKTLDEKFLPESVKTHPVTSVNGKTGAVTLNIPGKVSIPLNGDSFTSEALKEIMALISDKYCVELSVVCGSYLGYIPMCGISGDMSALFFSAVLPWDASGILANGTTIAAYFYEFKVNLSNGSIEHEVRKIACKQDV